MEKIRLAIVLTCYNRKAKTINCINKLMRAGYGSRKYSFTIRIFVCDDMSTDGTAEALKKYGENVALIQGTGDLFWARGMARAMEEAEKWNADFYLMVNDDVDFYDDAIDTMMNSYMQSSEKMCAIVGATQDPVTGQQTYGGEYWEVHGFKDISYIVKPCNPMAKCNRANWNCFLIPVNLYNEVGKIDSHYEHGGADFDYTKRIVDIGKNVFVADKYVGVCCRNKIKGTWRDLNMPMLQRIKAMNKKNGLPPKSQWYFCKKMYGSYAVWYFIRPYLSIIKNSILKKLRTEK